MANVSVMRKWETPNSTCGVLVVIPTFQCFTLEPPAGKRIPPGTYTAKMERTFAPHIIATLQRLGLPLLTPHLKGVPGWDDLGPHGPVEMHPGNTPEQTEGCTLVGMGHLVDVVEQSDTAFVELVRILPQEFQVTYADALVSAAAG
jgi:hypothetical protein